MIGPDAYTKWLEQCHATATIKKRYGPKSAFDYLAAEKLLDFAGVAEREPELARQLPRFISAVRHVFEADGIRTHLARAEREQEALEFVPLDEEVSDEGDVFRVDPEIYAARARSFSNCSPR